MSTIMDRNYLIYMAYYKDILYAISIDKKLVRNYMEYHRGFSKKEYSIQEEYLSDTDIISKYEDYVIEEYSGFYLPRIDISIITMNCSSLDDELNSLIDGLKRFILLVSHLNDSDSDVKILLSAFQVLSKYFEKKKHKKLKKENIRSSELLFCDIQTYRKYIFKYTEIRMSNKSYSDAWTRE